MNKIFLLIAVAVVAFFVFQKKEYKEKEKEAEPEKGGKPDLKPKPVNIGLVNDRFKKPLQQQQATPVNIWQMGQQQQQATPVNIWQQGKKEPQKVLFKNYEINNPIKKVFK